MVNLPVFFTSACATVASLSRSFAHCDFLISVSAASASASAPLVMALTAGAVFIAGAILNRGWRLIPM